MVSPDSAAEMARRLQSAEALLNSPGASLHDRTSTFEAGHSAPWSERTSLQVQRMEATIEQDLSKAMAGLREQFRHQFDSDCSGPASASSGGVASMEAPASLAEEADGKASAGGSTGSDALAPTTELHSSAAVMAEFRSEAAAARDEVLGGLARLRRDLEAERSRQSMQPILSSSNRGGGPGLVGAAAGAAGVVSETAFAELRRDMMMQQASVMEMRRDQTAWQEQYEIRLVSMEQRLAQIAIDLKDVRGMSRAETPAVEAKRNEGLLGDIKLLAERCEGIEQFMRNVATATAAKLEHFEGRLASDLAEERTAITRGLGVVNEMEKRTQGLVLALEAASTKHADDMKGVRTMCEEMLQEQASGVVDAEGAEGKLRAELRAELETLRGDLASLADGLAAERMLRVQDVAGLRAHAEGTAEKKDAVETAKDNTEEQPATAGSSLVVLDSVRAELVEEVSRQVRDAGVALRGHFAVGCAELRGEITARLDAYEEKLKQLQASSSQGSPAASQEQLIGRIDAAESRLQEVFHITQLLAVKSADTLLRFKEEAASAQLPGAGGARQERPPATESGGSQDGLKARSAGAATELSVAHFVKEDLSVSQFVKELGDELAAREAAAAAKEASQPPLESSTSDSMLPLISGELKDSLERLVAKVKDISNPLPHFEELGGDYEKEVEKLASDVQSLRSGLRLSGASMHMEKALARSVTAPPSNAFGNAKMNSAPPQLITSSDLQKEASAATPTLQTSPRDAAVVTKAAATSVQLPMTQQQPQPQLQPVIKQATQQAAPPLQATWPVIPQQAVQQAAPLTQTIQAFTPAPQQQAAPPQQAPPSAPKAPATASAPPSAPPTPSLSAVPRPGPLTGVTVSGGIQAQQPAVGCSPTAPAPARGRAPAGNFQASNSFVVSGTLPMPISGNGMPAQASTGAASIQRIVSPVLNRSVTSAAVPAQARSQRSNSPNRQVRQSSRTEPQKEWL